MYADDCQVYLNTSVEDVPLAVSKSAACVADINAWLSACRLRLNAVKTQLLWLGSSQLLDRVDCHWLPVRQRIHYKLASFAFRALSGLAPDFPCRRLSAGWRLWTETSAIR